MGRKQNRNSWILWNCNFPNCQILPMFWPKNPKKVNLWNWAYSIGIQLPIELFLNQIYLFEFTFSPILVKIATLPKITVFVQLFGKWPEEKLVNTFRTKFFTDHESALRIFKNKSKIWENLILPPVFQPKSTKNQRSFFFSEKRPVSPKK